MSTTEKKSKARVIKVIGGALLLVSFIVQNFSYDYWDTQSNDYYNANKDYSDMARSSLLYLNLYFNVKLDNDTVQQSIKYQYINAAANKAALGQLVDIANRDTDTQVKVDLSNLLLQKAKGVYDFKSFTDYVKYSREIDNYSLQDNILRVKKIALMRSRYRWGFLGAYILGTLFLLWGLRYE